MNPVIAVATSRLGPVIGILIGRVLPRGPSAWLTDRLADWAAAKPENHAVRAVRANQAVVRGWSVHDPRLNEIVLRVFRNAARGYLAFFRGMARGRDALEATCSMQPDLVRLLKSAEAEGRGVMLVGPHMGNFDIALLALHKHDLNPLVLSLPNPRGSVLVDNAIRRRYGVEMTPITPQSLRHAVERLRRGGLVLTLVDRPEPSGQTLTFFDRPTSLPNGHARLAQSTGALLVIVYAVQVGDGSYQIERGQTIDPKDFESPTRAQTVSQLAQAVASAMEPPIRRRPEEWLVFLPLWPESAASSK